MADELFNGIALAIGAQSGFGTVNSTVKALSGALVVGDGIILGDRNSGQAETGITLPNFSRVVREVAPVNFTQSADSYLYTAVEGLAISFPLKGNGADAGAPTVDAAKPDAGIDILYATAGLVGATGTAPPDYKYNPTTAVEYSTIHLWVADLDFILQDCSVETLEFACTAGEPVIVTANFKVGSVESRNQGVTFPTFTWGAQSSLAPPACEGVNFTNFGLVRGFEELTITMSNDVAEYGDSNVDVTGKRIDFNPRTITVDGRMYVHGNVGTGSEAAMVALEKTSAPTDDLSFQLGTADVGGAETELNAALVQVNNLEAKDIHYDRTGRNLVVELSGCKATGLTQGSEFQLTYN
jgi:hypothetical protein